MFMIVYHDGGGYQVIHRADNKRHAPDRRIDGPVYRDKKQHRLAYVQYGMGSGPWMVMVVDDMTGRAHRLRGSGEWDNLVAAVAGLRELAEARGFVEVTGELG